MPHTRKETGKWSSSSPTSLKSEKQARGEYLYATSPKQATGSSAQVQGLLHLAKPTVRFSDHLDNRSVHPQSKPTVNELGDRYEKEAECVADTIMRMPEPKTTKKPEEDAPSDQIHRLCSRCQRRHRQGKPLNCSECEQELQRKPEADGVPVAQGVEQAAAVASKSGRPLSVSTKSFFEGRMGSDFSDVRVHTGPKADQAARSIDARAFTLGSDVVFRSGEYRPDTQEGKRLLAHELTHVVQQDFARRRDRSSKGMSTIGSNRGTIWGGETPDSNGLSRMGAEAPIVQKQSTGKSSKICGPDITKLIVNHLTKFVSQKQGDVNPIWYLGANRLQSYARNNGKKIRDEANRVSKCPSSDCQGTYTVGGQCISGYHIDHILIMAYIEGSYGVRTARSAGQYNESFWLGALEEGMWVSGSQNPASNADLTFNEVAICLGEKQAHAGETDKGTDKLTKKEVTECFNNAGMKAIGQKESTAGSTKYTNCVPCTVAAPHPKNLQLPPIDL